MSTTRTVPPFRADHVGSLLRPASLLRARQEHADHVVDDARLREIEDDAIRSVIRTQGDVGLRTATDGEFRRASWHMDFIYRLGGVTRATDTMEVQFRNAEGTISFTPAALRVSDRIRLAETIFADDFDRERYLVLLGKVCRKLGWRVVAYCLMTNHVHLVVDVPARVARSITLAAMFMLCSS